MMMGLGFLIMLLVLAVPILLLVGLVLLMLKPFLLQQARAPMTPASGQSPATLIQEKCSHCGAKLQPEWVHCPECGAPTNG